MSELVLAAVEVVALAIKADLQKESKKRKRKVWVKPWIARRDELGASSTYQDGAG